MGVLVIKQAALLCEEQEGCVWETLGALRLSEAVTRILGGGEVSLTLEAGSGW